MCMHVNEAGHNKPSLDIHESCSLGKQRHYLFKRANTLDDPTSHSNHASTNQIGFCRFARHRQDICINKCIEICHPGLRSFLLQSRNIGRMLNDNFLIIEKILDTVDAKEDRVICDGRFAFIKLRHFQPMQIWTWEFRESVSKPG